MLKIDAVTVRIAGRAILEGASATIAEGQKVGLVGRNGAGKTTLLKLILGQLECETGSVSVPRGWRVGTVSQEAPSGADCLLDTVLAADMERAQLLAASDSEGDPGELAAIHARLEQIDAYRAPARAARILAGLGFSEADQQRPCAEFSGGWRMRVALAGVLFAAPDLLLLDEPTNYLDLEGALWLEDYLKRYRGTVLLVSHDRDLLNRAVESILYLEHGKLTLYAGGYDRFVEARSARRAQDAAAKTRELAERKRIQDFVDRFRYKASKARQAQSRLKMLERMASVTIVPEERAPEIRLPSPEPAAPPLIALENVSVGYRADAPVLSRLYMRIDHDDRIALLGQNGNGKSTLAKLLAGKLKPQSGQVMRARKLVTGYFAQHQLDELDGSRTPVEILSAYRPVLDELTIRTQLGGFGFSGEKADTPAASLSGGERARLMLALATLDKPNLLILDEPTNHLDIPAREELLNALNEYAGAVILISHDRRLLEGVADRFVLVADGRAQPYDGDMDEYRRLVLNAASATGASAPEKRGTKISSKADQRRDGAERRRALKPLKDAMDKAERDIATHQATIARIDQELAAPNLFVKTPERGNALSKERADVTCALQQAEKNWLDAAHSYETADADGDTKTV
jgi:ATP-binding cassette subfamily F protein 3